MPDQDYIDYYRMREASARDRAAHAANPSIARIHIELAECYARIVSSSADIKQMKLDQVPELPIIQAVPGGADQQDEVPSDPGELVASRSRLGPATGPRL